MVAGAGDALNTQDNVRRNDAEHDDLSHVHNLTRSRLGRLPMGTRRLRLLFTAGFSLASILDRQNLRLATAQVARPESRCASGARPCPRQRRTTALMMAMYKYSGR